MSIYIDVKYLNLLSNRLLLYKQKREFLWNFRCPICGDFKKNQQKPEDIFIEKIMIFFINAITAE